MRARMTALLLVAAVAAVAGCGGDDEPKIPRQNAEDIIAELKVAKRQAVRPQCSAVEETIVRIEDHVAELPEDSDVRNTLEDGVDHLRTLVEARCEAREREREETTDTDTDTETTDTDTDTTTQPPEPTEPPETTEPETTQTQPTTPTTPTTPDDGSGGAPVPQGSVKPKKPKDRD